MSKLPLDVLINILSLIPLARDRDDVGGFTLSSCLRVSSLFREAAGIPSLWKPHYQTRYTQSNEAKEQERYQMFGNDWRLMYLRRRKIDSTAIKLLEKMVANQTGRRQIATALVVQFNDIWDVLELELTCPVPPIFKDIKSDEYVEPRHIAEENVPPHSICRRYWAKQVFESITRGYGVSIWRRYAHSEEQISFDLMMSSLSTVFGVSDKEITGILDDLATLCRKDLGEKGINPNAGQCSYDLRATCQGICVFMRQEGYTSIYHAPPPGHRSIMYMFPHTYLTTHKATIPICLVHIFVAIACRLGIRASPVNFPATVLGHVQSSIPGHSAIIINPSALDTEHCIINDNPALIANSITQLQLLHQNLNNILAPCQSSAMLIRASQNLHLQHERMNVHLLERSDIHASALLPLCVHLIFEGDVYLLRSLFSRTKLRLFDCIFLLQELAPYLAPGPKQALEEECKKVLEKDDNLKYTIHGRMDNKPKYYVGMPIIHLIQGYKGFICNWDFSHSVDPVVNKSFYEVEEYYNKDQPHYSIITTHRGLTYVAEENIAVGRFDESDIQELYSNWEQFPIWFEGVQYSHATDITAEGLRLLMSPHLKNEFPDDDRAGAEMVLKIQ